MRMRADHRRLSPFQALLAISAWTDRRRGGCLRAGWAEPPGSVPRRYLIRVQGAVQLESPCGPDEWSGDERDGRDCSNERSLSAIKEGSRGALFTDEVR